jgi:hypothetical protein
MMGKLRKEILPDSLWSFVFLSARFIKTWALHVVGLEICFSYYSMSGGYCVQSAAEDART